MENSNIVMIRHHPMGVLFSNPFYINQFSKGDATADYIMIDVTSKSRDKSASADLSPFFLGPCTSSYGVEFKCFENLWQFSKVYDGATVFKKKISIKKDTPIPFVCSGTDGNPTEEWWNICRFGAESTIAHRHPFEGKPLYHYYKNTEGTIERLGYVESRKKVYIPEYAKLVSKTPTFAKLKSLVDEGREIALIDYDAYNYYNPDAMAKLYESRKNNAFKNGYAFPYTLNDFLQIKSMKDAVNFPGLLAGHGFVIKMLLQGDIEVIDGKVVDNIGVLE